MVRNAHQGTRGRHMNHGVHAVIPEPKIKPVPSHIVTSLRTIQPPYGGAAVAIMLES
jgi:hypothetical protein